MLHNTGPFAPGEQSVNIGGSLNLSVSQMNGIKLANNLVKSAQEQVQTPIGHYNVSNYGTSYSSQGLNMTSEIAQYSNYQSEFPVNFSMPNTTSNYSSWHNNSISMNSNFQHELQRQLKYPANCEKPLETPINMGTGRKDPRSVTPHIYNKEYFAHGLGYQEHDHYNIRTKELEHNIVTKTNEKVLMDSSRRRSLENTVKLIEDLLSSTTKHKEYQTTPASSDSVKTMEKIPTTTPELIKEDMSTNKELVVAETASKLYERLTIDNSSKKSTNTQKSEDVKDPESVESSMDSSPKSRNENLSSQLQIKLEELSWTDVDFPNPFLRDSNAVSKDKVESSRVVDGSISIYGAAEAAKSGNLKDKIYECPHCSILIQQPKRFLIHMKWHSLGVNRKTEMARKREMKKEAKIIEKMKSEEERKPKIFECKDCDAVFNSKSGLKNHRHRNHSARSVDHKVRPRVTISSFQCSECMKRFKHKHSLDKHRDTHLEKTHPCSECPKKFGSQVLLKMHMKSHERALRGPTFRCTYCGKGYYEAYTLHVHERTHRNERPFSCDICNANFGTNSSLKRHMRVSHSTSKPYECTTCHRCFISESIRNRHEQRVHGNPEDFKFTCKNCPSRYMKLKDLQRHLCKAHPKADKERTKSDDE